MAVRNGAIDEVLGEGEVAVIRAITDDGIITLIWDGKVLENILFGFQCQPRGNVKLSVFQKDSKPIQNIIGYPDGMVRPQGNITRAEVATIFFRLLSEETRAELVKIAASFDEKGADSDTPFEDAGNHWAAEYIALATENGWINGYEDQTFKPDQYITRAETMAVVNRVLQRLPRNKEDLLPGMITWPDNMDEDAWYYLYVQKATNGHTYERVNGSEHWIDWEETPDWKQYER